MAFVALPPKVSSTRKTLLEAGLPGNQKLVAKLHSFNMPSWMLAQSKNNLVWTKAYKRAWDLSASGLPSENNAAAKPIWKLPRHCSVSPAICFWLQEVHLMCTAAELPWKVWVLHEGCCGVMPHGSDSLTKAPAWSRKYSFSSEQ